MSNYPSGTPDLMTALADDGYSDFFADYTPDDDQLDKFIGDRFDEILDWFKQGWTLDDLREYWKQECELTIEKEWGNK